MNESNTNVPNKYKKKKQLETGLEDGEPIKK